MAGDYPDWQYIPETCHDYGYPPNVEGRNGQSVDLIVVHITIGNDSLDYLNGCHDNSAHHLTHKDGTHRAQLLLESKAAWAAGSRFYNERGVQIEHEKRNLSDPWTDEMYSNLAAVCRRIADRNHVPLVYLGRDNGPSKRGFIGHSDVPDPDGSGWGGSGNHTDPGDNFDWVRFMALVNGQAPAPPPADDVLVLPNNPFGPIPFVLGFKGYVQELGTARDAQDVTAGILSVVGYPKEVEWVGVDGNTYQRCERVVLQYTPGNSRPFDCVILPRDKRVPKRQAA